MLGFQIWIWLAVVLSIGALSLVVVKLRHRTLPYRVLVTLGTLSLIWGVAPVLGGHGISPYLVVGAIVAFGFVVLTDSMADNSRW